MSTDLVTVQPNSTVQLVASIMDWRHIRHVLVEDEEGKFCGLISHRDLLHVLAKCGSDQCSLARAVREIMNPDPGVTAPATQLRDAVKMMLDARTDSLPVVSEGRLVGIVTTQDVLRVLGKMLDADQNNCPIEKTRETSGSSSEAA